jgi:hypothetical protein
MQVNAGQLRTKISRLVEFRTKPLRFSPCGQSQEQTQRLRKANHDESGSYRSDCDQVIAQRNSFFSFQDGEAPNPNSDHDEPHYRNHIGKNGSAHANTRLQMGLIGPGQLEPMRGPDASLRPARMSP